VRAFDDLESCTPGLARTGGSALRITVAPPEEMQAMLAALDEAIAVCA
jgi:histidinol-phosphate/aromatic aminotransferase/cobyric acid decarboxylase-like protein